MKGYGMKTNGIFTALAVAGLCLGVSGASRPEQIRIGAPAPELEISAQVKGDEMKLAQYAGKTPVVLVFWSVTGRNNQAAFKLLNASVKKFSGRAAFASVAVESPEEIQQYPLLGQLDMPVASDTELASFFKYVRPGTAMPECAVVGVDGKLLWRGTAPLLDENLTGILDGTFDLELSRDMDDFAVELTGLLEDKKPAKAVELLFEGIREFPAQRAVLTSYIVTLCNNSLDDPDRALKTIEDGIAAEPQDSRYYIMALDLLRSRGRFDEMEPWVDRVVARFGSDAALMRRLADREMVEDVASVRHDYLYKFSRAAYRSGTYTDDNARGRAAVFHARTLYMCGRPDKALEVVIEAGKLFTDEKLKQNAADYEKMYQRIIEVGKNAD